MVSGRTCSSRLRRFWTRVLLRFVQFCSSLVAYVALLTASVSYQNTVGGQTVAVVVSSGPLNFARIVNFLVFLYAFAFLIVVEWLRLCIHPVHSCEKMMDLIAFVGLTTATLVLLLSKMTLYCHKQFGRFVQCDGLYLAVAISFLSALVFLASVLIGKHEEESRRRHEAYGHNVAYSEHDSPRTGATPVVTAQPA